VAGGDFDGDGLSDIAVHDYEVGRNTLREGQRITVIFGKRLAGGVFVRGRVNTDSAIDLSDAVAILGYLFLGSAAPACPDAADIDDSGELAITDAVYLLNHLFLGGRAPPPPYPDPARDPTPDSLACP
jgi:hypothetical protein